MKLLGTVPALIALASTATSAEALRPYVIESDTIPLPLTGRAGDADRGEGLVADRQASLCLLCHQGPFPEPHAQGTLAPDLHGVGKRLSEGQIRLRIVDMAQVNPSTIMPSYYRISEYERVALAWRGKPVLDAGAIEDIVAYLITLKD